MRGRLLRLCQLEDLMGTLDEVRESCQWDLVVKTLDIFYREKGRYVGSRVEIVSF